ILYVATDTGTIKIFVNDPAVVVRIDGQVTQIEMLGEPIKLWTGTHELTVSRGDSDTRTRLLVIRRGPDEALSVESDPTAPPRAATLFPRLLPPPARPLRLS